MSASPRLSIGMPVYNGEKYMRKALDSVLTQDFCDLELIISDNASTDSTPSICAEYARKDPRVRIVRQAGTSILPLNFQHAYRQACGEYFMWLACDDWWRPGFLRRAVAILAGNPNVNLVFSHLEMYNWALDRFGPKRSVTAGYGGPKTRLMTRILNPSPYLIHGIFRRETLQPDEMLLGDFVDNYFSELLAVRGDTAVVEDHLFVSGWTVEYRRSYSVFGGHRQRYRPYWKASRQLIRHNFSGPTRWAMTMAFAARTYRWMRHLQ